MLYLHIHRNFPASCDSGFSCLTLANEDNSKTKHVIMLTIVQTDRCFSHVVIGKGTNWPFDLRQSTLLSPPVQVAWWAHMQSASLSVCVYSGYIMHHYNGIWRNMHHQGAICTMVHKGDSSSRSQRSKVKVVGPRSKLFGKFCAPTTRGRCSTRMFSFSFSFRPPRFLFFPLTLFHLNKNTSVNA